MGDAVSKGWVCRTLLFGFPGCGKSEYPFVIAYKLKRELAINCSLLYIKCHRLASAHNEASAMKAHLREITKEIKKFQPIILAFDEFDAISPRRTSPSSSLAELSLWTMSFLANGSKEDKGEKIFVMGITNFPTQVDVAVLDRLQYRIYFGLPDTGVIAQMLGQQKIPHHEDVANLLIGRMAQRGLVVTGRGIMLACKAIQHIENCGEKVLSPDMRPDEIADRVLIHSPTINSKEISDYENENRIYIANSDVVVNYWSSIFKNPKSSKA